MQALKKTQEHAWLQQLVGVWRGEGSCSMGPGQPDQSWTVEESVRAIGDVWVQCESHGHMPDGDPCVMLITLGYDPDKQRFTGTFVGSMMTYLWVYEGALDPDGRTLTLDAQGPSMNGDGTLAKYQDIVEFRGEDERSLSSQIQLPDGTWQKFMSTRYRRKR